MGQEIGELKTTVATIVASVGKTDIKSALKAIVSERGTQSYEANHPHGVLTSIAATEI